MERKLNPIQHDLVRQMEDLQHLSFKRPSILKRISLNKDVPAYVALNVTSITKSIYNKINNFNKVIKQCNHNYKMCMNKKQSHILYTFLVHKLHFCKVNFTNSSSRQSLMSHKKMVTISSQGSTEYFDNLLYLKIEDYVNNLTNGRW